MAGIGSCKKNPDQLLLIFAKSTLLCMWSSGKPDMMSEGISTMEDKLLNFSNMYW